MSDLANDDRSLVRAAHPARPPSHAPGTYPPDGTSYKTSSAFCQLTALQVSHPDYRPLVAQLYPDDDPYVKSDTVFAVKDDLIVSFKPREGDPKATLDLEYNIVLAPKSLKTVSESRL